MSMHPDRPLPQAIARPHPIRRLLLALAASVAVSFALALASAAAHADVPDTRYCTAASTMTANPGGGFGYDVILRNSSNQPIANATVVFDFTTAPGISVCNDQDPDGDGRVFAQTNNSGLAHIFVKAGGTTSGRVTVGTATSAIVLAEIVTPDLDGDLDVDGVDHSALMSLYGTGGPTGDLDFDGDVDSADLAILDSHLGQNCSFTPVNVQTWGRLKALYR